MAILSGLQPENVFSYFEKLCAVPHGSGNTKTISDLCVSFARELGLKYRQDALNNVVIWKDAAPGYENAVPVILQGHLDMVCAKTPDCAKDMALEGLDLMTDGCDVWAKDTSLGGDDGIAVAMALAILADNTLQHPALEAVFTVDEETGMDGALGLDCSDLRGRKLLNIDSEEEGVFTVSCAGGMRVDCFMPGVQEPLDGEVGYLVTLDGLLGGHSGAEIHLGRVNANVTMIRVLFSAREQWDTLRLTALSGGKFDNVICNLATARVAVSANQAAQFESFIAAFEKVLRNEYAAIDPNLSLRCQKEEVKSALSVGKTDHLLHTLWALPYGVQAMSPDFEGMVQTSLNLGVVDMKPDGLHFTYSIRSNVASQKEMMRQKVEAIVTHAGGLAEIRSAYPGWQYAKESALRDTLVEVYRDQIGTDPAVVAIHAGLECGLFMEKIPGLDAVSLGPDLRNIHSVHERLSVPSTERIYRLICETLRRSK